MPFWLQFLNSQDQEDLTTNIPKMSDSNMKSLLPFSPIPPSDDEAKKSPISMKENYTFPTPKVPRTSSKISPVPTRKDAKTMHGQLLTPAPGRLTPTGQGRIKAPPVCMAPALKRVASSMNEFITEGVCFSPKEAESCAEKAFDNRGNFLEDRPLNAAMCETGFSWKDHTANLPPPIALTWHPEGKAHVSSSSTVVTNYSSASSCSRSAMGNEVAAMAAVAVKKGPPLEVVRTDSAVTSEVENLSGHVATAKTEVPQLSVATAPEAPSSLSTTFTKNLVEANLSRQGRSKQRWLISPTEELIRQVAGTIPITRDGRIILVSASRKTEWILPKGGWDVDETKEECAARETFEEGGLLGELGGCLEPIDYETRKAKKRRMSKLGGGCEEATKEKSKGGGKIKKRAGAEGFRPPLPKRAKADSLSPTGPELTSGLPESMCGSGAKEVPSATKSFDPSTYSYVRLFLCPLYVSEVKSDWPEKGRLRKLVDIDEAIKIMEAENRPYFQRGLEMVKERGLHLLKP